MYNVKLQINDTEINHYVITKVNIFNKQFENTINLQRNF